MENEKTRRKQRWWYYLPRCRFCGKIDMQSEERALEAITSIGDTSLEVYKCFWSNLWHIGHNRSKYAP